MDLSIIVPCCNEADNVPKIRDEFFPIVAELAHTRTVEVIFVDDGSTDDTWQALNSAFGHDLGPNITVRFERHPVNRGLGAAIRTGFAAARGELIVTADSDGTYKFATIPALLDYLKPGIDFVTASPYHPQGEVVGVPGYRLFLSRGASLLYRVLVNWRVHTWTCLYRAYRRKVIETITFESNGFLAGTELMVKAMLAGFRVAEYPAALHRRAFGSSKAKLARTVLAHLQFQMRVLWHRLKIAPLVKLQHVEGGQKWA
jgi:dolichol-phosphate mannosyltransferase